MRFVFTSRELVFPKENSFCSIYFSFVTPFGLIKKISQIPIIHNHHLPEVMAEISVYNILQEKDENDGI